MSEPVGPLPWWVGAAGWAVAYAGFVLAIAWWLNPILIEGVPRGMSNHRDYTLVARSGKYGLEVRRIGYGFGSPWLARVPDRPARGWIKINGSSFFPSRLPRISDELSFEAASGTYSYTTSPGRPTNGTLDVPALLAWMKVSGVDVTDPAVQAEAADLIELVRAPDFSSTPELAVKEFQIGLITGGPQWEPARKGQWMLHAAWAVVTGLAGWVILRRCRRRQPAVQGFSLDERM